MEQRRRSGFKPSCMSNQHPEISVASRAPVRVTVFKKVTKRPKLVTEMSCRSGTWVHLRCTLNATTAPFLDKSSDVPAEE